MNEQRKDQTLEEKVAVLRRHLVDGVLIGGLQTLWGSGRRYSTAGRRVLREPRGLRHVRTSPHCLQSDAGTMRSMAVP